MNERTPGEGCGSHSCKLRRGPLKGLGNNGPCRCAERMADLERQVAERDEQNSRELARAQARAEAGPSPGAQGREGKMTPELIVVCSYCFDQPGEKNVLVRRDRFLHLPSCEYVKLFQPEDYKPATATPSSW